MNKLKDFRFANFILFLVFSTFILSVCQKQENTPDETVNYAWDYASHHPDGFMLNIQKKEPVTRGISVAYFETQNSFGKESLNKVVEHTFKHEAIVGGWLNTDDSLYYFDSDKIFPDGAYAEAISFAKENQQLSIYDPTNDSLIWIEYPKMVSFYSFSEPVNQRHIHPAHITNR